jgi:hypothetical protein
VTLLCFSPGRGAFGQAPPPIGTEFRINTLTDGTGLASAAPLPLGGFVLTWEGIAGYDSVFARLFDSAGAPQGPEFLVNTYTTSPGFVSFHPRVASDSAGNFIIVWDNRTGGGGLNSFGQRFDSSGAPQGGEFQVNSYTTGDQRVTDVATDAAGDFIVLWESDDGDNTGVFARRFDSSANPQGLEFRVNTGTTDRQGSGKAAIDGSGNLLVVWHSRTEVVSPADFDIMAQWYDSSGGTSGGEFQVNSPSTGSENSPSVAANAAGDFVVVWGGPDGYNSRGPSGQRFDSAGTFLGGNFVINTDTLGLQGSGSIAMNADGSFVVVYSSHHEPDPADGDGQGSFGQHYDSNGERDGYEFAINSYTTGGQASNAVIATPDGGFVAIFSSLLEDGGLAGDSSSRTGFRTKSVGTRVSGSQGTPRCSLKRVRDPAILDAI